MPMRVLLVANPFATNVTPERVEAVAVRLARVGEILVELTQHPGHATELARAVDADALVVYSGDGGYNEALNGLAGDVPIGFLPGGGTSVLPRALGLPHDPVAAAVQVADALAAQRTRRITLGRVNGRRFAFAAGIGVDAEAVRRVDELGRSPDGRRPGDLAFVSTFAKLVFERRGRFDPVLEVDGYGRAAFILVSNASPYTFLKALAIKAAPEAVFDEGLDFLAPRFLSPRTLPPLVFALATGKPARNAFRGHDLDRIEVRCDRPLPLQADGEDLGDVSEAVFESERRAVTVLG
jgi:diacylglycerol kinase family enzyme